MFDISSTNFSYFLTYLPLGIVGVWRWSVWLFKKIVAYRYKPYPVVDGITERWDVSVITPVYNEKVEVLQKALDSWIVNNPKEIIAVTDISDTSSINVLREYEQKTNGLVRLEITSRPGKREALADGIRSSVGDILVLTDSDTIWDNGILPKLLSPFVDATVGAVAPRQELMEKNTYVLKVYGMQLSERYDTELAFLDVLGNATTCVSGRTAVYRRESIIGLVDELETETFAGQKCISGDDKCLTRLVQRDRWQVRYQSTAIVFTYGASDLITFLKQRLRWTRNSWRSDLTSLFDTTYWIWNEKALAFHTIDRFMQPFILLFGPIYLVISLMRKDYAIALVLVLWWVISRVVKLWIYFRKQPKEIVALPAYVVLVYVASILKIYALFSVTSQGWKTRWSKNRLSSISIRQWIVKVFFPAMMTVFTIFTIALVANGYKISNNYQVIDTNWDPDSLTPYYDKSTRDELENSIVSSSFATYRMKFGDTFHSVAKKYNIPVEDILDTNPVLLTETDYVGELLQIPVQSLRNAWEATSLLKPTPVNNSLIINYIPFTYGETGSSTLDFVQNQNIIQVKGRGSVVTLSTIYTYLNTQYPGQDYLIDEGDGTWLLNASLDIGTDVIFVVSKYDGVEWLKLKSSNDYFVWLAAFGGGVLIEDTKVTSWDILNNTYDTEVRADGRSFILVKDNGRMDVINSKIAYLGYSVYAENPRGYPSGGTYGLSWRISTGTFGDSLVTGVVSGTEMFGNEFGFYTYGASGMLVENNLAHNNIGYGFDPHDDSNHMILKGNVANNNGSHGIIISKRCVDNLLVDNLSYENQGHGIMLDRDSNNNIVKNNMVYKNVDGIVLYDSHENVIIGNELKNNQKSGIRLNVFSSRNIFLENNIHNNPTNIYFYDNSWMNYVSNNTISNAKIGAKVYDSEVNIFEGNSFENINNKLLILGNSEGSGLIE